jgi:hypothetical protein
VCAGALPDDFVQEILPAEDGVEHDFEVMLAVGSQSR